MKPKINLAAFLIGLAIAAGSLHAQTTIDFSTYAGGTTVSSATDTTFATETSGGVLGTAAAGSAPFNGGLTNSVSGSYPTTEFLNVYFTRAASNLSFVFNPQGGDPNISYTVYNSSGTVLVTVPLASGGNPVMYTVTQSGVAELQISNGFSGGNYEFDLDSLTFNIGAALFPTAGLNPNQTSVVNSLNNTPFTGSSALQTAFGAAITANPNGEASYLNQLSPQAFGQFTTQTAFNNASFETEALDNYLAGRCGADGTFLGGNGTVDASGLTVNDPSYDPALAVIHSRMLAWNPAPASRVISDVGTPLLGGVDMKADENPNSMGPATRSHPWNVSVRGNVILAQGYSSQNVSHFDDNTESVVLSTDYRIDPNFLLGLTAGYGHTDATLDNNGSSASVDSYSPGFYASYANHGWYANLDGSYVHNAYTQSRVIGFLGQTATSAPEGNEGVANLDGGYDFHHGGLTFGPLAGLQYTHLTTDAYTEGGSLANLTVNEQDADSLRSRLGGRVSFTYAYSGIQLTPHLDASWQHEFLDQSRGITSQFTGAGLGSFSIRTDNPSRDSALVDAGFDAQLNDTVTLFADYEVQAGQDNYFGQSVQGGLKIGF
jgi:uncharacterized protein YhjY with autotransporter beta-barrel domain